METWQKWLLGGTVVGIATYALWRLWPEKAEGQQMFPSEGFDPNYGYGNGLPRTPVPGGIPGAYLNSGTLQSALPLPLQSGIPQSVMTTAPAASQRRTPIPGCPEGWSINPATGSCSPYVE